MRFAAANDVLPPAVAGPRPALWEWIAAAGVIVMMTGAFVPFIAPDQGVETPALRLMWLPVYAVTLMLAMRRAREIAAVWPALVLAVGLVALAFVSSRWSLEPDKTARRSIALALSMLFAVYLGGVFRGPNLLRLLCFAFVPMLLASLATVAAAPALGVHQDVNAGMWRGVWYEKNQAGMMCFTAVLAATSLLVSGARDRVLPILTIALGLAMLAGSQSKTALLCLLAGGGVIVGLHLLRRTGPVGGVVLVWLGVVAGGALLTAFLLTPETFYALLGKEASLTGRTEIWDSLMRRAAEQPWTGYGYAAFWGKESMPANWVRLETDWDVPSAHHGWLEVLIQLGRIGVTAVAATFLLAVVLTLVRLRRQGADEGYFAAGYLMALGVLSLSESVLLLHHNLTWALFVAVLAGRFLPDPHAVPVLERVRWEAPRRPTPQFRSVRA